jgi:glucose 1-dehydrogenase
MKIKPLFDLTGRTALITGSSQGIGRAIAFALAEHGAKVLIHCRDEVDQAQEVATEIREMGAEAGVIFYDLGLEDAGPQIAAEAKRLFGPTHILVLNASYQIRKKWEEVTSDEFSQQVNINLRSSLQLIQHLVGGMAEGKWGRILTIGSVQQAKPHPQMPVYAATKAAQVNLVKNLAQQLAGQGITVNNLAPGVIMTPRNEEALSDPAYRLQVAARIPVGFFGEPYDCAALALLLCSDAGRYITGADMPVDGGMSG